jgi:hypothetical protein
MQKCVHAPKRRRNTLIPVKGQIPVVHTDEALDRQRARGSPPQSRTVLVRRGLTTTMGTEEAEERRVVPPAATRFRSQTWHIRSSNDAAAGCGNRTEPLSSTLPAQAGNDWFEGTFLSAPQATHQLSWRERIIKNNNLVNRTREGLQLEHTLVGRSTTRAIIIGTAVMCVVGFALTLSSGKLRDRHSEQG